MLHIGESNTYECHNEYCSDYIFHKPKSIELVDSVVEAVRNDLLNRSKVGIEKYGVTLDRKDLNLRDWLQHAYEETLDQANYLKRAIMELDDGTKDEKAAKT